MMRYIVSSMVFFCLLFSPQLLAKTQRLQLKSQLRYRSHIGAIGRYDLKIDRGQVWVNGHPVDKTVLIAFQKQIVTVSTFSKFLSERCLAGYYIQTVKKGKKSRTEKKCLTDPWFGQMQKAYKKLLLSPPASVK